MATKAAVKASKPPAKKAVKKAVPAKRKAVAKKPAPAKKKAVAKKPAPAKKKAVAKKAVPARKKGVAKKAVPARPAVKKTAVKKPAAKKAAPSRQVASPPKLPAAASFGARAARKAPPKRKGPLDKFLLGQVDALKEERATYLQQATSLRAEADSLVFERDPGDVQFDEESGEGDTIAVERERDLTLSAQALAAVEDIDLALAKIKDGTYGVCEQCNNVIPKERLRALPYAALCVQCKSAGFSRR